MTIQEKLQEIMKYSKLSVRALANKCGIKQPTLDRQIKGISELSISTLINLLESYPEISTEWLLRDKGEMLLNNESNVSHETERISTLVDTIRTLQEVINEKNATIATLMERNKLLESHYKIK